MIHVIECVDLVLFKQGYKVETRKLPILFSFLQRLF